LAALPDHVVSPVAEARCSRIYKGMREFKSVWWMAACLDHAAQLTDLLR
jgi:hypothetical protein